MALLPDGDTGPSILGDTRQRNDTTSSTAPQMEATPHSDHDTKGN
jgi:hypothetical protein